MAQALLKRAEPPFVLNLTRFESLCKARGFGTKTAFIKASTIPRRTFQAVLAGEQDFKMSTAAFFTDTLETSIDYLFTRTDAPVKVAA